MIATQHEASQLPVLETPRRVDRGELARLMEAMSAGSSSAIFEFHESYRPQLERMVGSILVSLHRADLARSASEVFSLAVSAALVVFRRSKGWRPDGALPWVWAYRSIRHEIVCQIGHPTVPFEPAIHAEAHTAEPAAGDAVIDLRELATRHEGVAAWVGAVDVVASERDRCVHLEYQVQKQLGDPSPALTVAAMFGLSPANVRQIDRRVRKRLAASASASHEAVRLAAGVV